MDDVFDKKGLINESYKIKNIGKEECRSIFLDWVLSAPDQSTIPSLITQLLEKYEAKHPDHPMTDNLRAALQPPPKPVRRGGRYARNRRI